MESKNCLSVGAAAVCLVLISGFAAHSQPASIKVRSHVALEAGVRIVRLGDVAEIKGLPSRDKKTLSRIILGDAPTGDETRIFKRFPLAEILRVPIASIEQHSDLDIHLSLPPRLIVQRKITAKLLNQQIADYFHDQCAPCRIHVSQISLPSSLGSFDEWSIRYPSTMPRGSFAIPVVLSRAKHPQRVLWINGKLSIFKKVAVATKEIDPGNRVQPSDFVLENKDVTYSNDTPALGSNLVGAVSKRGIAANQIIWQDWLARPKALRRGELVKIVAGNKSWQVAVSGVAEQDGYIGDLVHVKNPTTNRELMGTVIAKGTVQIQ